MKNSSGLFFRGLWLTGYMFQRSRFSQRRLFSIDFRKTWKLTSRNKASRRRRSGEISKKCVGRWAVNVSSPWTWMKFGFAFKGFFQCKSINICQEPQTTGLKWMFGETTISDIKVLNHPIETTIYKWLFGVPGIIDVPMFLEYLAWLIRFVFFLLPTMGDDSPWNGNHSGNILSIPGTLNNHLWFHDGFQEKGSSEGHAFLLWPDKPQAATIEARNFSEGSIKAANGKREIQGGFVDELWTNDSLKRIGTFTPIVGV